MNGRLVEILERIRHRNTVKAEAQKDISFFHSLDRDEDRLSFLKSLDPMEKAAFIEESLKGRAGRTSVHALHLHRDADGADVDRWYIEGRTKIGGRQYSILSYPDENRIDMYHPTCEGVHCPVLYFYFSGWKADDCPRINGKVFAGHELLDLLDSSNRNLKDMMPKLRPL